MRINLIAAALLVLLLPVTAFAQPAGSNIAVDRLVPSKAALCVEDAIAFDSGAVALNSYSLAELIDDDFAAEAGAAGTTCAGKLYGCDDGAGGSEIVKKWKNCDECSSANPDHCTGCCTYFIDSTQPTKRSLCCANKCGTTC